MDDRKALMAVIIAKLVDKFASPECVPFSRGLLSHLFLRVRFLLKKGAVAVAEHSQQSDTTWLRSKRM